MERTVNANFEDIAQGELLQVSLPNTEDADGVSFNVENGGSTTIELTDGQAKLLEDSGYKISGYSSTYTTVGSDHPVWGDTTGGEMGPIPTPTPPSSPEPSPQPAPLPSPPADEAATPVEPLSGEGAAAPA